MQLAGVVGHPVAIHAPESLHGVVGGLECRSNNRAARVTGVLLAAWGSVLRAHPLGFDARDDDVPVAFLQQVATMQ